MAKGKAHDEVPRTVIYLLKSVQDALRAEIDEALEPLTLTSPQMAVLSALSGSSPLSNAELARAAFVKPQSMIPVLQSLEGAGWIKRRAAGSGRRMPAELTPEGRKRLKEGRSATRDIEARMLDGLSPEDAQHLRDLLEHCLRSLRPRR